MKTPYCSEPSLLEQAQQGNLEAITFWLNVELVPQGFRTQVQRLPSGGLSVQVKCRRLPDQDSLVREICDRLSNLSIIYDQRVKISACLGQRVNVTLWQTTVQFSKPLPKPDLGNPSTSTSPQEGRSPLAQLLQRRLQKPENQDKPQVPSSATSAEMRSPQSTEESPWVSRLTQLVNHLRRPQIFISVGLTAFLLGCGLELAFQASRSDRMRSMQWPLFQSSESTSSVSTAPEPPQRTIVDVVATSAGDVPVVQFSPATASAEPVTLMFSPSSLFSLPTASGSEFNSELDSDSEFWSAIAQADVAITHLAEPLPSAWRWPWQSSDPASRDALALFQQAGIDVVHLGGVSLSDPDSSDSSDSSSGTSLGTWGETRDRLHRQEMYAVGSGSSDHWFHQPVVIEVQGQRLAYLSYTISPPPSQEIRNWQTTMARSLSQDIEPLRSQVDWVIVSYSWNANLVDYPSAWQVDLTHLAVDHGADLVVGYHPTLLQGGEIYQGRAIAYSLGILDWQSTEPDQLQYKTALLQISLSPDQLRAQFLPIQVTENQAAIATGLSKLNILNYLTQASGLFSRPLRSPTALSTDRSNAPSFHPPMPLPSDLTDEDFPDDPSQLPDSPLDALESLESLDADDTERSPSFTSP